MLQALAKFVYDQSLAGREAEAALQDVVSRR